jgi:hypothetical protein
MALTAFRLVFFCLIFVGVHSSTYAAPDSKPSTTPTPLAMNSDVELNALRTEKQKLEAALNKANADYQQLKQMSGQAIYLNQTNQKMREELEMTKIEVEKLTQQNRQLSEDNRVDGIIQGTIAVLVGALLALFIPRISHRKSFSGWH